MNDKKNDRAKLWQAFQHFQLMLTLTEMQLIRRHLIAIEKALFTKK